MEEQLKQAKELLLTGEYTFVLINNGKEITSSFRGIKPMLSTYENSPEIMENAVIADKVIGEAAARIAAQGKVAAIYTPIVSKAAAKVCEENNIYLSSDKIVPAIKNRAKDGFCPMEKISKESPSFNQLLDNIHAFISKMK